MSGLLPLCALLSVLASGMVAAQPSGPYYADFAVAGSGYFCWTQWLDRDNPSGTGDHETLADMPKSKVCERPVGIECKTITKIRWDLTGELGCMLVFDASDG